MIRLACFAIVAVAFTGPLCAGPAGADERTVWLLEDTYWQYFQSNDLEHYRALWHNDFLGWPVTNSEPVHKEHITEWIALHTSIGETLRSYDLERLAATATGSYVTVAYRAHMAWVATGGAEKPSTIRVIHTWLRTADGKWQIISGMAASPNAQGH